MEGSINSGDVLDETFLAEGVEENVASRFIDYTFATPWEVLIGNVERGIKGFLGKLALTSAAAAATAAAPLSRDQATLALEYNDFSFYLALDQPYSNTWMTKWFDLTTPYFTVCHNGEWRSDSDPSSRRTFFSALVCALADIDTSFPIFFIPATKSNYDKASGILGYRIQRLGPTAIVTNYDSMKEEYYDRMSSFKHHLFYLDGAMEYFHERTAMYGTAASMFPLLANESAEKMVRVEVVESYCCTNEALKFMAIYHYNESSFLPRDQSSFIVNLKHQSLYLRQAFRFNRNRSVSASINEEDDESYNSLSPVETRSSLLLEALRSLDVTLAYRGTRLDFRVDNHNYTTMLPSKQPPNAWSCSASFATHSRSTKPITAQQRLKLQYGHEYSFCLRHLLANYIVSKATTAGVSATNLFSLRKKAKEVVNVDKAKQTATSLSPAVQELVGNLSAQMFNTVQNLRYADHQIQHHLHQQQLDLHSKFLRLLFPPLPTLGGGDEAAGSGGSRITSLGSYNSSFSIASATLTMPLSPQPQHQTHEMATLLFPFLYESTDETDMKVNYPATASAAVDSPADKNGSSVEHPALGWVALIALYSSTLPNSLQSIAALWTVCVQQMRERWENGQPMAHIKPYHPEGDKRASDSTLPETLDCLHRSLNLSNVPCADHHDLLYKHHLWDDVVDELQQLDSGWKDLCLPDRRLSLFNQKLQMLQFCSAVKHKSHVLTWSPENETRGRVDLLRRLPVTDDAVSQYHRLAYKLVSSRQQQQSSPAVASSSSSSSSSSQQVASSPGSGSGVHDEPSTIIPQGQQLFFYQVLLPSLVSDIRSFKAADPNLSFEAFFDWYGVHQGSDRVSDPAQVPALFSTACSLDSPSNPHDEATSTACTNQLRSFLKDVWDQCDACPAADQKPLFRVVTEAEKCLTFFENMTAPRLLLEMIVAAMPALYALLCHDVCAVIIDLLPLCSTDADLHEICDGIVGSLQTLYQAIREVITDVREHMDSTVADDIDACSNSSSSVEGSGNSSSSSSSSGGSQATVSPEQSILLAIDAIEKKIGDVEDFLLRYRSLAILLFPPAVDTTGLPINITHDFKDIKKLALRLTKHERAIAKSEAEAQILLVLAKNSMIPGTLASDLAQAQGRELSPLKKTINIERPLVSPQNMLALKASGKLTPDVLREVEHSVQRLSISVSDESIRASLSLADFDE